jgi:hypothetical protein
VLEGEEAGGGLGAGALFGFGDDGFAAGFGDEVFGAGLGVGFVGWLCGGAGEPTVM